MRMDTQSNSLLLKSMPRVALGAALVFALSVPCAAQRTFSPPAQADGYPPEPPVRPGRLGETPAGEEAPVPPRRPDTLAPPATAPLAQEKLTHLPAVECEESLLARGVELDRKRVIGVPDNPACAISGPVILVSIRDPADASKSVRFPDRPLIACAMAERIADYTFQTLMPMARESLKGEITAIGTGPGYTCRTRNHLPGAKMSSHSTGLAIDIMHIEYGSKQRFTVETLTGDGQQQFLKSLLTSACVVFNTVLGPASDSFHRTNIHIDIEPRGKDGKSKFCQ